MSKTRKKFDKGIRLKEEDLTAEALSKKGEVAVDSNDSKLKYHDGTSTKEVADTDSSQTLTNKSIDADNNTISNLETDNLKSGVMVTDVSAATSDTEIPSALAVKNALDGQNEASEIDYTPATPGDYNSVPSKVKPALDELASRINVSEGDVSAHVNDATDAHDASAISNVPSGNLAATDVQGALNELQSDVDTRVADGGSFTSGSVITPDRLDAKQDTEANLTTYASTASNGQFVFATDTKKMYQIIDNALAEVGGGSGTLVEVNQTTHGFAVGDGIYHNGTSWVKGQANASTTIATYCVTEVTDVDNFIAYQFGRVEAPSHGFTVGEWYYLSTSVAGSPVTTEPTTSDFSNPLFFVEDANTLQISVYRALDQSPDALGDLSDVNTGGASNGQALLFNAGSWAPGNVASSADAVTYDNATSGLTATDTQAAIDEVEGRLDTAESNISTNASDLTTHIADTTTHGTTGDIVGTSDFQALTNKDIDGGGASNSNRITLPKATRSSLDSLTRKEGTVVYSTDEKTVLVDDGTSLIGLGSGGGINYIDNDDAEAGTTGWSTYNDSSEIPVDGTGGSAAITFSASATDPLRGSKSFLIEKGASANRQGQGISYDFTIDDADKGQLAAVSFDYSVTADYSSDNIKVYLYDVTNSRLINLVEAGVEAKSPAGKYLGYGTFSGGSTSYRVMVHIGSNDTDDYDIKIDNFRVGPADSKLLTNNNDVVVIARNSTGNTITAFTERIDFTTVEDSHGSWTQDGGHGPNKFTAPESGFYAIEGHIRSTANLVQQILLYKNGSNYQQIGGITASGASSTMHKFSSIVKLEAGDEIDIRCDQTMTIQGSESIRNWITIVKIGKSLNESDSSGRTVFVEGSGNGDTSITADVTAIDFTEVEDTHAAWDGSTFTAPEGGIYDVTGMVRITGNSTSNIRLFKNGTFFKQGGEHNISNLIKPFSIVVNLVKGDTVDIRLSSAATLDNETENHWINITKIAELPDVVQPNFSKWQTKYLSSDQTSAGDFIVFNNLKIGRTYEVSGQIFKAPFDNQEVGIELWSGSGGTGTKYSRLFQTLNGSISSNITSTAISTKFTAVSTSLYVRKPNGNKIIYGDGTAHETFVTLTELPLHIEVDTF